jgi:hypothetical protein
MLLAFIMRDWLCTKNGVYATYSVIKTGSGSDRVGFQMGLIVFSPWTRSLPLPVLIWARSLFLQIDNVALLRSEENLLELPFYKHYVPNGTRAWLEKSRHKNKRS